MKLKKNQLFFLWQGAHKSKLSSYDDRIYISQGKGVHGEKRIKKKENQEKQEQKKIQKEKEEKSIQTQG